MMLHRRLAEMWGSVVLGMGDGAAQWRLSKSASCKG